MKPVRSHSFNGRKYQIIVTPPLDGLCSTYKPERELYLFESLKTKNGLITAIHEGLHASAWSASEEKVDQTSRDIGGFLWRLGFRWMGAEL